MKTDQVKKTRNQNVFELNQDIFERGEMLNKQKNQFSITLFEANSKKTHYERTQQRLQKTKTKYIFI